MGRKINLQAVKSAKPGAKTWFEWDSEIKGFGIKITPNGVKSYVLQYRTGKAHTGPTRRMVIGRHGSPWTPDTARSEAKRLLGQVEVGADPAAERKEARQAETVSELADRFLTDHAATRTKATTAKEYRRIVEKHIRPTLGRRKLGDVTRAEVTRLHQNLRRTSREANHVLAVLSKMFNLAERWGLRPDNTNPCRHVERFKETHRRRFLSPAELARLGAALADAERDGALTIPADGDQPERTVQMNPFAIAALRLLIFTGARLSEIMGLRWEEVDLEGAVLRLPDSKTGAKTIHLNAPALAVVERLPRMEGCPYVLPGRGKNGEPTALTNLYHWWYAVRDYADLKDVRIHDLRHSFASIAVAGGLALPVIGGLLGHTQAATTQRYAHLADDPLKVAAQMVGARLADAMRGGAQPDNVVTLPTGKRRPRKGAR